MPISAMWVLPSQLQREPAKKLKGQDGDSIYTEMVLIDQDIMVLFQIVMLVFEIRSLEAVVFVSG